MSESQSVLMFQTSSMSEKLCLKWNDFQENVNAAFGNLREDNEFADVTLASEDGQQIEAHKVILEGGISANSKRVPPYFWQFLVFMPACALNLRELLFWVPI